MNNLALLSVIFFFAVRYATISIDPDKGMFMLEGTTDSWYGRDYADCKSPLVHLLFWAISKVVGKKVVPMNFLYTFLVGSFGLVYYNLTGNFAVSLGYIFLVNSGWLLGFHGNVGQVPAGLILLSFVTPQWASVSLWVLATLYNPKLIFTMIAFVVIKGYYIPSLVWVGIGIVSAALLWYVKGVWFDWVYEAVIKIPKEMNKNRKGVWMPSFTATGLLYLIPLILLSFRNVSILFWIPPLVYLITISLGHVIRPNHLIPLVAWIVVAASPNTLLLFLLVDLLASGFYIGNIWKRFYPGIEIENKTAEIVGTMIGNNTGTLWVNGMFTQIYAYAGKPLFYGCEQIEIREVTPGRRKATMLLYNERKPDWIVETPGVGIAMKYKGYQVVHKINGFSVMRLE